MIVRAWCAAGWGSVFGRTRASLTDTPVVLGSVLGAHGTALTRRVLGREASTCSSLRVGNRPGRALEVGICSCPWWALLVCV